MTDTNLGASAGYDNARVAPGDLPTIAALDFTDLAPGYGRMLMALCGAVYVTVSVIVTILYHLSDDAHGQFPLYAPLLGLFVIFADVFVYLHFHHRACGYALRERDLHYKHGVLWQALVSLPFTRVQHVEVERGPIERLFGLATLKFFTAGGGSADMKIPGLLSADATKLRNFVLQQAGADDDDV